MGGSEKSDRPGWAEPAGAALSLPARGNVSWALVAD